MSGILDFNRDKPAAAAETGGDPVMALKDDEVECPPITVRTGASTLTIAGKPSASDPTALELRYQGTIVRTARECAVRAGIMNMKIGIEGRVIVGPAGGPGQVEVPLRLAVVHDGPTAKTVTTKLIRIPVTVADGAPYANFEHVDQEIAFPLPRPLAAIDSYVVYVGFDPAAAAPPQRERPRARPAPKRS